jgi:imidazole glycerol-phosphate synthase
LVRTYDRGLLATTSSRLDPASSGAGKAAHFVDVFRATDCEAALAAGIFHRGEVPIAAVKTALQEAAIPVRPAL